MHAGTAPRQPDALTVTVVVGLAGEIVGGSGWGIALRAERQIDDGLAAGVQLGGGRGDEGERNDGHVMRHKLYEVRGYGRVQSPTYDWAAGLGSLGLTWMDSGMLAATLAIGGAVSYPNEHAVPALGLFGAWSLPLRKGAGFGPAGDKHVARTLWWGASAGLVVPVPTTGNALSADVGIAFGSGVHRATELSASVADSHTFSPSGP